MEKNYPNLANLQNWGEKKKMSSCTYLGETCQFYKGSVSTEHNTVSRENVL